jgi:hypothetical protein
LRRGCLAAIALLAALGLGAVARGDTVTGGGVTVSFDGGISPRALPRTGTAPVAVSVDGSFKSTEGADPPPQLQTIAVEINRRGKIFDRGLPTCQVRKIQPATMAAARRICGGAIVGSGHIQARINLSNQPPFTFDGPMLVFHAKRSGGKRRLLAQIYGRKPPSAFVLNFKILKVPGELGTLIKTSVSKSARKWAYVTRFEMKLRRIYTYKGQQHSYISASCPAPAGFDIGLYEFAQAHFGFAEGLHVVTPKLVRECAVR